MPPQTHRPSEPGTQPRVARTFRPWKWLLALLVLIPLAALLWRIEPSAVYAAFSLLGLRRALLCGLLQASSLSFAILRWRRLVQGYGGELSPREAFEQFAIAQYVNFLPGGIAGDALRAGALRAKGMPVSTALWCLVAERAAGLLGLIAIAGIAWGLGPTLGAPVPRLLLWGAGVAVALLVLLVSLLPGWLARGHGSRLRVRLGLPDEVFRPRRRGVLLETLAWSTLTQGCFVASMLVVVVTAEASANWGLATVVAPWVVIALIIPLTPLGVGQRELVFVHLWGLAQIRPEAALAASLLHFGVGVLLVVVLAGLALRGNPFAIARVLGLRAAKGAMPGTDALRG